MPTLSKLTKSNQVTIPKYIVEKLQLKQKEDYLEVEYHNGIIYLKPVSIEERILPEAFEKLHKKAFRKEPGDLVLDEKRAKTYLRKRMKKRMRKR